MTEETSILPNQDFKKPYVIIGSKPIGSYLHAILQEFQMSNYVYVYYFEDKSQIISSLFGLLMYVGIVEIRRRHIKEVPSLHNPKIFINRYELRWDKNPELKSLHFQNMPSDIVHGIKKIFD